MEELTYSSPEITMSVLPAVGARIHRLTAFGHDVLRTPADPAEHLRDPFFWGAYSMAPWCNRIDARPTNVAGATVDVPTNFRDGSAIHGQVYARPWNVDGDGSLRVSGGSDGWPWPYAVTMEVKVMGPTVRIDQNVTNLGNSWMPAGIGFHPWFRRPVEVAIMGDAVFPTNTDSPPSADPVTGRFDLRRLGAMERGLDATWTQLAAPQVELRWPDVNVEAAISVHSSTTFIVAASPGDLDAIAVEPQTHAPQGLRRLISDEPGALALLEPGGALTLTTEISFKRVQEGRP